jgi:hypothetical protein
VSSYNFIQEISADAWMTPDDILEIGCCAGFLHRILARAMCTDYVAETLGRCDNPGTSRCLHRR